ncbi:MAG: hypothetical protein ABEK16_01535 [Candidatus Nanohalobium sp.]
MKRRTLLKGGAAGAAGVGVLGGDVLLDGESDIAEFLVPDSTLKTMNGSDYDKRQWLSKTEDLEDDIDQAFKDIQTNFGKEFKGEGNPYEGTRGPFHVNSYDGNGVEFGGVALSTSEGPFTRNIGPNDGHTAEFWEVPGEDGNAEKVGDLLSEKYSGEGETLNEQQTASRIVEDAANQADVSLRESDRNEIVDLLNGKGEKEGLFDLGIFVQQTTGENANEQPDYEDLGTDQVSELQQARDAFGAMAQNVTELEQDNTLRELNEDASDRVGDLTANANYDFIFGVPFLVDDGHDETTDFKKKEAKRVLNSGHYDEDIESGNGRIEVGYGGNSYTGVRGLNEAATVLNFEAGAKKASAIALRDTFDYILEQAQADAEHYDQGEFDNQGEPADYSGGSSNPAEPGSACYEDISLENLPDRYQEDISNDLGQSNLSFTYDPESDILRVENGSGDAQTYTAVGEDIVC